MKKILRILLVATFLITTSALNAVEWLTLKEAYQVKDLIKKPIFLMVGSSSCSYCKKEISIIENDKELSRMISSSFIPVYIEQDNPKDTEILPEEFYAEYTPTIFVVDYKSGRPFADPAVGAVPGRVLKMWLGEILSKMQENNTESTRR